MLIKAAFIHLGSFTLESTFLLFMKFNNFFKSSCALNSRFSCVPPHFSVNQPETGWGLYQYSWGPVG